MNDEGSTMNDRSTGIARIVISVFLFIILLALGIAGLLKLKSLSKPAERGAMAPPLTRVDVLRLKKQDYREILRGYGRCRAMLRTVVSSEVQGVVLKVAPELEAGARVRKGVVLVEIDESDYRETLARKQATLEQNQAQLKHQESDILSLETQLAVARAELELSLAELERRIQMYKNDVASPDEVDRQRRATKAVELAALKIENALHLGRITTTQISSTMKSTLVDIKRAERDMARCQLRAPYDGVIESRLVQPGALMAPGTELFRILDPNRVEVPVALPASAFGDVQVGAEVKVETTNDSRSSWSTTIARIAPQLQVDDRTFQVFVVIEATAEKAAPPPGAFLRATIEGPLRRGVFVLPRTAFLDDEVLVLKEGHAGRSAQVEGLRLKIDQFLPDVALSKDPHAEGREIVLDNLEQIASGSEVEILNVRTSLGPEVLEK